MKGRRQLRNAPPRLNAALLAVAARTCRLSISIHETLLRRGSTGGGGVGGRISLACGSSSVGAGGKRSPQRNSASW